jgi:N-acetylmuramoyl-L-alanine amidase
VKRRVIYGLALLLAACSSTGPRIDTRYTAQGQDSRVQFIVLHYTVGNFPSALKTLTQTAVSSHYLVAQEPPTVYRLVDEDRRAFHAGISVYDNHTRLNANSVGIEIVNAGYIDSPTGNYTPFPQPQIDVVIKLVRDIAQRHGVKPHRIVGHSDIAPGRKQDPGPLFPWPQLVAAGLVPWPDAQQVATARAALEREGVPAAGWFQQRLAQLGQTGVPRSGVWDAGTRDALMAFQMKYRPALFMGKPDAETAALLQVATTPGGLLLVGADGVARPYGP